MSTGLLALLDDVAGLAKVAAASLDDVAAQAGRAGVKAAGIVIDDAAVTPRYVVGFTADRELPIIGRIALGSLKNKLLYLLPAALLLSLLAPWAITPLLMIGGAYLCYEGAEKVYEALWPHGAHAHEATVATAVSARDFEEQKVRGAIRTDFILSAEIMAISLSTVADASPWLQAAILAVVGIGITGVVYGGVALIVKADDFGLALAAGERPLAALAGLFRRGERAALPTTAPGPGRPVSRAFGRALVWGMPVFLKALSVVGTAAMIWVGGGIIVHGLEEYGFGALGHGIHDAAAAAGHALPALGALIEWLVTAAASGVVGLLLGALLIPFVQYLAAPLAKRFRAPGRTSAPHASS